MFIWALVLQILLNELGTSTVWVSSVKHVEEDIGTIDDLVELLPNSLRLSLREHIILGSRLRVMDIIFVEINILIRVVPVILLISLE